MLEIVENIIRLMEQESQDEYCEALKMLDKIFFHQGQAFSQMSLNKLNQFVIPKLIHKLYQFDTYHKDLSLIIQILRSVQGLSYKCLIQNQVIKALHILHNKIGNLINQDVLLFLIGLRNPQALQTFGPEKIIKIIFEQIVKTQKEDQRDLIQFFNDCIRVFKSKNTQKTTILCVLKIMDMPNKLLNLICYLNLILQKMPDYRYLVKSIILKKIVQLINSNPMFTNEKIVQICYELKLKEDNNQFDQLFLSDQLAELLQEKGDTDQFTFLKNNEWFQFCNYNFQIHWVSDILQILCKDQNAIQNLLRSQFLFKMIPNDGQSLDIETIMIFDTLFQNIGNLFPQYEQDLFQFLDAFKQKLLSNIQNEQIIESIIQILITFHVKNLYQNEICEYLHDYQYILQNRFQFIDLKNKFFYFYPQLKEKGLVFSQLQIENMSFYQYHQAIDQIFPIISYFDKDFLNDLELKIIPKIIFQLNKYESFSLYMEKSLKVMEVYLRILLQQNQNTLQNYPQFRVKEIYIESLSQIHKKFGKELDQVIYCQIDLLLQLQIFYQEILQIPAYILSYFDAKELIEMHDKFYEQFKNNQSYFRLTRYLNKQDFINFSTIEPLIYQIVLIIEYTQDQNDIQQSLSILNLYLTNQVVQQQLTNIKIITQLIKFIRIQANYWGPGITVQSEILEGCHKLMLLNKKTENNFILCGFLQNFLHWIRFLVDDQNQTVKAILLHLCKDHSRIDLLFSSQIVSEMIKVYQKKVNQDLYEVFIFFLQNFVDNSRKQCIVNKIYRLCCYSQQRNILSAFLNINLKKIQNPKQFEIDFVIQMLIKFHNLRMFHNEIISFLVSNQKITKQALLPIQDNQQIIQELNRCYPMIEHQ